MMPSKAPSMLDMVKHLRASDEDDLDPYPTPVSLGSDNYFPLQGDFEGAVDSAIKKHEDAIVRLRNLSLTSSSSRYVSSPLGSLETDRSSSLYASCSTASDSPPPSPSPVTPTQFHANQRFYTFNARLERTNEDHPVSYGEEPAKIVVNPTHESIKKSAINVSPKPTKSKHAPRKQRSVRDSLQPFNARWDAFVKSCSEEEKKETVRKEPLQHTRHDPAVVSKLVKEDLAAFRRSRYSKSQSSLRESFRGDESQPSNPSRPQTATETSRQVAQVEVPPPVPPIPDEHLQPPGQVKSLAALQPLSPTFSSSTYSSIDARLHSDRDSPLESFAEAARDFHEAKRSCDYSIVPRPLVLRKKKTFDPVPWWKFPKPPKGIPKALQVSLSSKRDSAKSDEVEDDDDGTSTLILARNNAVDTDDDDRTTIHAAFSDQDSEELTTPTSIEENTHTVSIDHQEQLSRKATAEDYSNDFPVFEALQRESLVLPCAPVDESYDARHVVRQTFSTESLGRPCSGVIVKNSVNRDKQIVIDKAPPAPKRPWPRPIQVNGIIHRLPREPPILTEIHPALRSSDNTQSSSGCVNGNGQKCRIPEEKMQQLMLTVKAANMIADKSLGKLPLDENGDPDCPPDHFPLQRVPTAEIERNLAKYNVTLTPPREENFKTKTVSFFKRMFRGSKRDHDHSTPTLAYHKHRDYDPTTPLIAHHFARRASQEMAFERERRLRLLHSSLMIESPVSPALSSPKEYVFEKRERRDWLDTVYDDVLSKEE